MLWALLYATLLILFLIAAGLQVPQSWANQILNVNLALSIVSIVHAFLARKEYLLRLDLLRQQTSNVSITTRGRRWELKHSIWIIWTFTLLFNWIAFIYIGFRVRRVRWILWGLMYFMPFLALAAASNTAGPGSLPARVTVPLMIVVGIASIVHAFLVRDDYLVRLENRMQEATETGARRRRRLEAQYRLEIGESPQSGSSEQPTPSTESPVTSVGSEEPDTHEKAATSPPDAVPALTPGEVNTGFGSTINGSLQRDSVLDTYPLPVAFSWALLTSL
jgi:hypothetical protein